MHGTDTDYESFLFTKSNISHRNSEPDLSLMPFVHRYIHTVFQNFG